MTMNRRILGKATIVAMMPTLSFMSDIVGSTCLGVEPLFEVPKFKSQNLLEVLPGQFFDVGNDWKIKKLKKSDIIYDGDYYALFPTGIGLSYGYIFKRYNLEHFTRPLDIFNRFLDYCKASNMKPDPIIYIDDNYRTGFSCETKEEYQCRLIKDERIYFSNKWIVKYIDTISIDGKSYYDDGFQTIVLLDNSVETLQSIIIRAEKMNMKSGIIHIDKNEYTHVLINKV